MNCINNFNVLTRKTFTSILLHYNLRYFLPHTDGVVNDILS